MATNLTEGQARLSAALELLGFDENGAWNRMELLAAVRKFAVAAGDDALETACDRRLADLDEVAFGGGGSGMAQVPLFPRVASATKISRN